VSCDWRFASSPTCWRSIGTISVCIRGSSTPLPWASFRPGANASAVLQRQRRMVPSVGGMSSSSCVRSAYVPSISCAASRGGRSHGQTSARRCPA
jgi:hypothetical protein